MRVLVKIDKPVPSARQQCQRQPVIQIEDLQKGQGERFLPLNGRKVDWNTWRTTFRLNFRQAKGFPWKLKRRATTILQPQTYLTLHFSLCSSSPSNCKNRIANYSSSGFSSGNWIEFHQVVSWIRGVPTFAREIFSIRVSNLMMTRRRKRFHIHWPTFRRHAQGANRNLRTLDPTQCEEKRYMRQRARIAGQILRKANWFVSGRQSGPKCISEVFTV